MTLESAFSMDTSSIKYGPGVTHEIGWDMEELGARRVMVVTDPNLTESEPVAVTLEASRYQDFAAAGQRRRSEAVVLGFDGDMVDIEGRGQKSDERSSTCHFQGMKSKRP